MALAVDVLAGAHNWPGAGPYWSEADSMTEMDLITVYFEALDAANGNFQFWLSATFAFILAFHVVGPDISRGLRRTLVALYLLSAAVFLLRFNNAGFAILDTRALLEEAGTRINLFQALAADVIGPLINVIMFFGTGAAVLFATRVGAKPTPADQSGTS